MTQTVFTPEKVRELSEFIMWSNTGFTIEDYEKRITDWLEKNPIEPIVVGLSDEQIKRLSDHLRNDCLRGEKMDMVGLIAKWQKTQAFVETDAGIADIRPNWGDSSTKYFQIRECWVDERGTVTSWKLNKQFERPKPTPQIEVGQVWRHIRKGLNCEVLGFLKTQVNREWIDYVRYTEGDAEYSQPTDTFLAKFGLVRGSDDN